MTEHAAVGPRKRKRSRLAEIIEPPSSEELELLSNALAELHKEHTTTHDPTSNPADATHNKSVNQSAASVDIIDTAVPDTKRMRVSESSLGHSPSYVPAMTPDERAKQAWIRGREKNGTVSPVRVTYSGSDYWGGAFDDVYERKPTVLLNAHRGYSLLPSFDYDVPPSRYGASAPAAADSGSGSGSGNHMQTRLQTMMTEEDQIAWAIIESTKDLSPVVKRTDSKTAPSAMSEAEHATQRKERLARELDNFRQAEAHRIQAEKRKMNQSKSCEDDDHGSPAAVYADDTVATTLLQKTPRQMAVILPYSTDICHLLQREPTHLARTAAQVNSAFQHISLASYLRSAMPTPHERYRSVYGGLPLCRLSTCGDSPVVIDTGFMITTASACLQLSRIVHHQNDNKDAKAGVALAVHVEDITPMERIHSVMYDCPDMFGSLSEWRYNRCKSTHFYTGAQPVSSRQDVPHTMNNKIHWYTSEYSYYTGQTYAVNDCITLGDGFHVNKPSYIANVLVADDDQVRYADIAQAVVFAQEKQMRRVMFIRTIKQLIGPNGTLHQLPTPIIGLIFKSLMPASPEANGMEFHLNKHHPMSSCVPEPWIGRSIPRCLYSKKNITPPRVDLNFFQVENSSRYSVFEFSAVQVKPEIHTIEVTGCGQVDIEAASAFDIIKGLHCNVRHNGILRITESCQMATNVTISAADRAFVHLSGVSIDSLHVTLEGAAILHIQRSFMKNKCKIDAFEDSTIIIEDYCHGMASKDGGATRLLDIQLHDVALCYLQRDGQIVTQAERELVLGR